MTEFKEYTVRLNIEHLDMFCQNTKEEIEEILSKIINDKLNEIFDTNFKVK